VLQYVLSVRPVAGNEVELRQGNAALPVGALEPHLGVQGHEGDAQIGRVNSYAVLAGAEDRMHPRNACQRRAARARRALVAGRDVPVAEVAAARALQQVAADRRHVAQLHRRTHQQGLSHHRCPLTHREISRELLHGGQRPHLERVAGTGDAVQREPPDVDQPVRVDHRVLQHQVELVGATGQVGGPRITAHHRHGTGHVAGAHILERGHRATRLPIRRRRGSRHDVGVRPTPTEVAAHELADLGVGARPALLQQGDSRHDLPGSAVATLEAVVADERRLHRVQLPVLGQPFDSRHFPALALCRQHQARNDALAVEQNRASPARPLVTAFLGTGQVQVLAQRIEQRHLAVHLHLGHGPVDAQLHSHFGRRPGFHRDIPSVHTGRR
jgi:hypothetical protein